MDWEAIGAVGEIIGATAVVVTLVYLTTQIRQNTRQLASTSLQGLADRAENRMLLVASSPEFAAIFAKFQNEPDSLSETEIFQFRAWVTAWLTDLEDTYRQFRLGTVEPSTMFARVRFFRYLHQVPLVRGWWNEGKEFSEPDFVGWLDQQLSQ